MKTFNRNRFLMLIPAISLLASSFPLVAQNALPAQGSISTIAGNGTAGMSGDGGEAINASMQPSGIALDAVGNLFVGDGLNCRLRTVTNATGIITTLVAGSSSPSWGMGCDPTQGVGAITSLTSDQHGNLYFTESFGRNPTSPFDNNGQQCHIYKRTATTGVISSEAGSGMLYTDGGCKSQSGDGGMALIANINPSAVAVDLNGNIYFVEAGYHDSSFVIRKIDATTGTITTVAGNSSLGFSGDGGLATNAQFGIVKSIAIDSAGNIYIADSGNARIRVVNASTGVITTIAGNGSQGFSGDGGIATSASIDVHSLAIDQAGNIYSSNNDRVRMVLASTGIISSVAGKGYVNGTSSGDGDLATDAEIISAGAMTIDQSGNLYFIDDTRIRVVSSGAGTIPSSYNVSVSSSDANPTMGEALTLTATVVNSLMQQATSGSVAWSLASQPIGTSQISSDGKATIMATVASGGDQAITANYKGSSQKTGVLTLHVKGFAVSSPTEALVVHDGKSASFTLMASAFNGFIGQVDLKCTGLPSPGECQLSTSTVDLTNSDTTQNVTITVKTAATTVAQASTVPLGGLVFAGGIPLLGLFGLFSRKGRKLAMLSVVTAACVFCTTGCGSKTALVAPVQLAQTLAPGTYTINIVAQSGASTITIPATVTVQ